MKVYNTLTRQKEDLIPIMGEESMIQELPDPFNKVLEEQKQWKTKKLK